MAALDVGEFTGHGDGLNATLGWSYAGLRVVHSLVQATVNRVLVRFGFYELTWHPALFRVSLFVCLAALLGLAVYR